MTDRYLASEASTAERVTFLLHTRGRLDFLLRTLDYFAELSTEAGPRLMVLDASDEADWQQIQLDVAARRFRSQIELRHSSGSTPLLDRLVAGLDEVGTPYVALAANDDFYLPGWLDQAVEELDADPDIAVIHGHVIFFELADYAAKAPLRHYFIHPRALPPLGWLEGDTAAERIAASSTGPEGPSVPGWYALQRTTQLRTILSHAHRIGLPDAYLEYWLVFYQAVLGKTRMLDRIILARQADPGAYHRGVDPRSAGRWLAILRTEFLHLLEESGPASEGASAALVDRYLAGVASEIEVHARRNPFRRLLAKNARLRNAWDRIRALRGPAANTTATAYPDPRLPRIPPLPKNHPAVQLIARWTTSQQAEG